MNQLGLTLIELLVVIAMIAILAGVAAPNLSGWNCRQSTLKDFSDLASAIAYLQGLAKDQNRSMRLEPTGTKPSVTYLYYQAKRSNDLGAAKQTRCSTSLDQWTQLPGEKTELDGTFGSSTSRSACFHGDGSVNQVQSLTWRVNRQCDGKSVDYRIKVFGSTGFMEKEKWDSSTRAWVEF